MQKQRSMHVGVVFMALVMLPHAMAAQGGSILELLPYVGQLSVGDESHGALSSSDVLSVEQSYMEAWALEGRPGESVTIDLVTNDFDPMLMVVGPGMKREAVADSGGDRCNARLTLTFLESGAYHVIATSAIFSGRQTGTYTLRVSADEPTLDGVGCGEVDLSGIPLGERTVELGGVGTGVLSTQDYEISDDRYGDVWAFDGLAEQVVVISLESADFDADLFVTGQELTENLEDDDGGNGLDSRLTFVVPVDGTYQIVVTSAAGGTGSYILSVADSAGATRLSRRTIEFGGVETGLLSTQDRIADDRYANVWQFDGLAGQVAVVSLESADFDAYLAVTGQELTRTLEDDDGGDGLNSRLTFTVPVDGTYQIVVTSVGGGTGLYTLSVGGSVRTIEVGGGVETGVLSTGEPAQVWAFDGLAEQVLAIILESEDFEGDLLVTGQELTENLEDDDRATRSETRLTFAAPADGTYRIVVTSKRDGGTGSYTLSVGDASLSTLDPEGRSISVGEEASGILSGGTDLSPVTTTYGPVQAWALQGGAGQSVTIQLTSDEFETHVYLVGPGISAPLEGNESREIPYSRINTTLPETGRYLVIVSSNYWRGGTFLLSVSALTGSGGEGSRPGY